MGKISDNELERRRKVAEEKIWGLLIESIEKSRKKHIARSIALRLFFLYESVRKFQETVRTMGKRVNPLTTTAPSFTVEQTNFLIRTYNSIIEDIHSHLRKKDSYIDSFSTLEELDKPTINEVAKTLFIMGTNILQLLSYMIRWI